MNLLETHDWQLAPIVLQYVRALFDRILHNTLALENGYTDLRDNEQRGARHMSRSPITLSALSISSAGSRYQATVDFPIVSAEDVSSVSNLHVRNALFKAENGPHTEAYTLIIMSPESPT